MKSYWLFMSAFFCVMGLIFFMTEEATRPSITLKCKFNKESRYTYTFKVSKNKLFVYETDNNPNTDRDFYLITSKSTTALDIKSLGGKEYVLLYESYGSIRWGVYYRENYETKPYRFLACGEGRVPRFTKSEENILHN